MRVVGGIYNLGNPSNLVLFQFSPSLSMEETSIEVFLIELSLEERFSRAAESERNFSLNRGGGSLT